jgi:hypothetical protein
VHDAVVIGELGSAFMWRWCLFSSSANHVILEVVIRTRDPATLTSEAHPIIDTFKIGLMVVYDFGRLAVNEIK